MKKIKAFLIAVVTMFCFATGVQAQKISMTVADQHYAAQAGFYKMAMGLLAVVYIVYRVVIGYRKREVGRYMGANN